MEVRQAPPVIENSPVTIAHRSGLGISSAIVPVNALPREKAEASGAVCNEARASELSYVSFGGVS